ncbi:hypothetical protein R5R35_009211 [Gryllus longicercus]
MPGDWPL